MKPITNKNRVCLTLALSLLTGLSVFAAPFDRTWNVKQPDGTVIQVHGKGDEFYADVELNGYTILFDSATSFYVYAQRLADGTLVPSRLVAGKDDPAALNIPKHVRPEASVRQQLRKQRFERWDKETKNSARWKARKDRTAKLLSPSAAATGSLVEGPSAAPPPVEGPLAAPPAAAVTGNKVGLCLLIDFPDDEATVPQGNIADFCNGDAYAGYGNHGSVKKYFQDVSNQRLTYSNIVTVYLRAPHPKPYYNDPAKNDGDGANELVKDALDALKALPNYAAEIWPQLQALTVDGSGRVVACNIFYAGEPDVGWSKGLWPHSWSLYRVGEQSLGPGVAVFNYQMTDIGASLQIGTFCHENGHMLCDFPDLYDYNYDSKGGAGDFCLMGYGANTVAPVQPCAYLRMHVGWLDAVNLETIPDNVAALTSSGTSVFKYTKPTAATEYFLFENRYRAGRDLAIPGTGIAIWHCDERGNRDDQRHDYNALHQNFEVQLMQADNLWHLNANANAGHQEDLYYDGNPAAAYVGAFADDTAPSSRWWDGSESQLFVGVFSVPGVTMTMSLIRPDPEFLSQSPLPEGRVGSPYDFQFTGKNIFGSNRWSVVEGSVLPPGLTMDPSGRLSGIPTVAGTNQFFIGITGSDATVYSNRYELVILPAHTAPFFEGFESGLGGPRTSWYYEYVSNAIPWRVRTGSPSGHPSRAFEGEKNLYLGIYNDGGSASLTNHITRLLSPMIQFGPSAREARISFAYYLEDRLAILKDAFKIYYRIAGSDEWLGPLATYNAVSPLWLQQSVTLPESAAGKSIYFAIEGYALGGHGVSLDAIQIDDPVPPLQIVNVSPFTPAVCGTNYTLGSPYVTLQAVGGYTNGLGQTAYEFAVAGGSLPSGFTLTAGGLIIGQSATPIALTSFDVEVIDLVRGAKATNTLAFAVEYPRAPILQENFLASKGSLPTGWTIEYVANMVNWKIGYPGGKDGWSPPSTAQSDNQYAFFFGTPGVGSYMVSKLVSPVFDLTQMPNNSRLVFWHFMQKWAGQDELRVYYRNVMGGPWTRLETYTNNVTSWTLRTIQLPSPSRTYQIAFEGSAKSGYGVCVDSVSITDDASAPIILTRDTLPSGFDNFRYQTQLQAVGGAPPYQWSVVSNALPRGLTLDPVTGVISGIPAGSTQTVFRVAVTGLDNKASTNLFYLNILPPGFIPYVQSFSGPTLPSGWQQNLLSGTATWRTVRGTYSEYESPWKYPSIPVSETNNLCLWGSLGQIHRAEVITEPFDLGGCTNTAVTFNLCMRRYLNQPGYQDWLTLWYDTHQDGHWKKLVAFDVNYFTKTNAVLFNAWTNLVLALPEPSATYRLKFEGTTRGGCGICIDDLVILGERTAPPLVITTPNPLPDGTNSVVYPDVPLTATGGTILPYTWSIVGSDIFPPGLTLNPTNGVISGTPTQYGLYTFGVTVQDANNVTTTQDYTLRVWSSGLTPYQMWVQSYYNPTNTYPGDGADSGDGIPNLIKYGMDLDPTIQNTGVYILGGQTNLVGVPGLPDGGYLYYTYRRSLIATDLVFSVTGKTNLADVAELWITNNIVELTPWSVGQTGVWSWVHNVHTTPITNAPQRFLRLEVQLK